MLIQLKESKSKEDRGTSSQKYLVKASKQGCQNQKRAKGGGQKEIAKGDSQKKNAKEWSDYESQKRRGQKAW